MTARLNSQKPFYQKQKLKASGRDHWVSRILFICGFHMKNKTHLEGMYMKVASK